jgi:hypothetical protein
MQNHEQKKKMKENKKPKFYGKTKTSLSILPFSHMAACRSSSKNIGKMNLIPVLNKTSPRAHMESELDVLGVPRKLVKYVLHLSKRKI